MRLIKGDMAKAHTLKAFLNKLNTYKIKNGDPTVDLSRGLQNMDQFRKEGAVQGQKVSIGPIALWGDVGICSKIIFNISDLMSPQCTARRF